MTRRLIRLAGANTPRRTVNKPRIVPPAEQADRLLAALAAAKVDAAGLAEAHTDLVRAIRAEDTPYEVHRAGANDVFPRTRIGNATVALTGTRNGWDTLDRRNLRLDGGDKPLRQGVVRSRRRQDDQVLTTVAGHLWSRPAATDAEWLAGVLTIREFADAVDGPVALIADWNRGRAIVRHYFPARQGWRVAAFAGVTGIIVRGLDPRNERTLTRGIHPQVTDHREGIVIAACAAACNSTEQRLPR